VRLDWIDLHLLCDELSAKLPGARLQEIFQIDDDRVILGLYRSTRRFLHIHIHPQHGSIYLLSTREKAPGAPPPFCSLLRKHLLNSRLESVSSAQGDRVCEILFTKEEESFTLVIDLRGVRSNLYILDQDRKLFNGLRPAHGYQEGGTYTLDPHPRPSLQDFVWEADKIDAAWKNQDQSYLVSNVKEITPGFATWLLEHEKPENFSDFAMQKLQEVQNTPVYQLFLDELGIQDYNIYPGKRWEGEIATHETASALLSEFYRSYADQYLLRTVKTRVFKVLEQELEKLARKETNLGEKLTLYQTHPEIEMRGSLLNAQREKINPFSKTVKLVNFHQDCQELVLQIDPRLSPAGNVDRIFRLSRKYRRGIPRVEAQIEELLTARRFLNRTLEKLKHETDHRLIEEHYLKLQDLGVLKPKRVQKQKSTKKISSRARLLFTSEFVEIYSGRNDRENDWILRKIGKKEDLWFHAKDVPGAHVLLRQDSRVSEVSIREAAQLAAYLSSKRSEGRAEVIYTPLKYVKKMAGMGPGQVKVQKHETLTVKLDSGILKRLAKNHRQGYENT
jgi:predicted ribosome quality control (RQC) complex YloA/Tae2 family protein